MLKAIIKRDIQLISIKKFEILQLLIFSLIVNFIFSFILSNDLSLKPFELGVAITFVCQILSINLAKRWIFERDFELKILQQIHLSSVSSAKYISAKITSNYLIFGFPVALFCPLTLIFFNLDFYSIYKIMLCTLITGLILSIVSVMLSAITVGIRNGGALSIILSIPLLLPVIILNASFLLDKNLDYQNLISGNLGLALILCCLSIFSGYIGISSAAKD